MAAGAGKDFLIDIDAGGGVFVQVGGLRSSGLSGAAEEIDITTVDEDQWKTILAGAGIKSFGLTGSGVLKDTAPIDQVRAAFRSKFAGCRVIQQYARKLCRQGLKRRKSKTFARKKHKRIRYLVKPGQLFFRDKVHF